MKAPIPLVATSSEAISRPDMSVLQLTRRPPPTLPLPRFNTALLVAAVSAPVASVPSVSGLPAPLAIDVAPPVSATLPPKLLA